ncbi:MAG TPA: FtsX-like permease family protein [Planctomycetota bacterium]|nr:FtsX-like permease family protein [Planctomycetota bacterium]
MLILKNLLRRRTRTILSTLGIALGIAAIIAFNAVGRGFKESLDRYMRSTGAEVLVVNRSAMAPEYSRISKEEVDQVRALPGVEHLSPGTFTIISGRVLRKPKIKFLTVFGRVPGDRLIEKFKGSLEGRLFQADDEMILGSDAARDLELRPGDTLELLHHPLKVVGIYKSDVKFESAGCVVPSSMIQQEMKMGDSVGLFWLYLKPGTDWKGLRTLIEEKCPNLAAIQTSEFTAYYNQLDYIDWFVWIVSLISVVVGGLGVLNTMLMSVSERTREIGTLRAVGWSRGQVLRLILTEGILISIIGGCLGLLLGTFGAETLIHWAPRGLDTRYSGLLLTQGFLIAVALGFFGALYPAWQASRLSPIEALKYE